jgi:predicted DNA-binding ribbon-helix-helix protein
MARVDTVNNQTSHRRGGDRLSLLVPRNVLIDGHRTSVKLEQGLWDALLRIAAHQEMSVNELVSDINRTRVTNNLTSAVRAYVVDYLCNVLDETDVYF